MKKEPNKTPHAELTSTHPNSTELNPTRIVSWAATKDRRNDSLPTDWMREIRVGTTSSELEGSYSAPISGGSLHH